MPVAIKGSGGGSVTLDAGAASADTTLTLPNTTGTVINTAPGTSGNVLTSTGSAWASTAPASSVATGTIIKYGSTTTPSGYLKCDGSTYTSSSYATLAGILGSLPVSRPVASTSLITSGQSFISYVNGYVVDFGYASTLGNYKLAYSSDSGATWSYTTLVINLSYMRQGIWTGTYYVFPGYDPCLNPGVWYTTSLGTAPSNYNSGAIANVTFGDPGLVWTGSKIFGIYDGGSGYLFYSATGSPTSWASTTTNASIISYSIAASSSIVVLVGNLSNVPKISTTTDGVTITSRTVPASITGTKIQYVSYVNSLFVAVDNIGNVISSADGITWASKGKMGVPSAITYISTVGIYCSYGSYSTDLINWSGFPISPGYPTFMLGGGSSGVWTGTRYVNYTAQAWSPLPYTTATQFVVPDFGGDGIGASINGAGGAFGAVNYIKT